MVRRRRSSRDLGQGLVVEQMSPQSCRFQAAVSEIHVLGSLSLKTVVLKKTCGSAVGCAARLNTVVCTVESCLF